MHNEPQGIGMSQHFPAMRLRTAPRKHDHAAAVGLQASNRVHRHVPAFVRIPARHFDQHGFRLEAAA